MKSEVDIKYKLLTLTQKNEPSLSEWGMYKSLTDETEIKTLKWVLSQKAHKKTKHKIT